MSDDALVYEREVAAPREVVFSCMTQPEHLAEFWGPHGTSSPVDGIVVELHEGGRFETLIVNDADGGTHQMRAVFTEVREPSRLAWTETGSGVETTVSVAEAGPQSTRLRIEQRHVPPAWRDPAARSGFASSLDRFETYLSTVTEDV